MDPGWMTWLIVDEDIQEVHSGGMTLDSRPWIWTHGLWDHDPGMRHPRTMYPDGMDRGWNAWLIVDEDIHDVHYVDPSPG